jgi:hypothetical protein
MGSSFIKCARKRATVTDPKKMAWIAICGVIGAIFAGAIGEALSASHAIAVVCAVLGGALGAAIASTDTHRHLAPSPECIAVGASSGPRSLNPPAALTRCNRENRTKATTTGSCLPLQGGHCPAAVLARPRGAANRHIAGQRASAGQCAQAWCLRPRMRSPRGGFARPVSLLLMLHRAGQPIGRYPPRRL